MSIVWLVFWLNWIEMRSNSMKYRQFPPLCCVLQPTTSNIWWPYFVSFKNLSYSFLANFRFTFMDLCSFCYMHVCTMSGLSRPGAFLSRSPQTFKRKFMRKNGEHIWDTYKVMTTNSAQEFPFDKYLKNMFSTQVAFRGRYECCICRISIELKISLVDECRCWIEQRKWK